MLLPLTLVLLAALVLALWGPGSHLEYAERVYRRRRELLPTDVARLLESHREAWYYGNLAADIIHFKGYGGPYNHCHRWAIVDEMMELSTGGAQEAFVLGYLGHLAADTIAHNHFVPYHLARYARSTKGLGHLYWELYADRYVPEKRWAIVTRLKADRELDSLDELVNACVARKAFSMKTNKALFNHGLLVGERESWRRAMDRLQDRSPAPLEKGFLERFRRAAVARIRLALHPSGRAKLAHVDTNGREAQRQAMQARRRILRAYPPSRSRREESERAAAPFLEGMETPPPTLSSARPSAAR